MSTSVRRSQSCFVLALVAVFANGCSSGSSGPSPIATPTPVASTVPASAQRPCDIYATATPCVAAFSTTRALYATYAGPLYQIARASDGTTLAIGLAGGGYANAAAQDAFCSGTTCTITRIFDQSANHNDLTVAPPGGNAIGSGPGGDDLPAVANALPILAGGHEAYGIAIVPGMGYRNDATTAVPTGSQPQGVYMVTSSTDVNPYCCFDFGNAETSNTDTGAGSMDAINIICRGGTPCGDQAGLDLENGIYGSLPVTMGLPFVTDMGSNDGQTDYSIWQGDAQNGALTSTGPVSLPSGYSPMRQQGAIILGIGGDNSDRASGQFFEGAITQGTPTATVMGEVQSNIVAVSYATSASASASASSRSRNRP